jgi:hypothetical protein
VLAFPLRCKPGYLRELLVRSGLEFGVAAIVIVAELTLGVLEGIGVGVTRSAP